MEKGSLINFLRFFFLETWDDFGNNFFFRQSFDLLFINFIINLKFEGRFYFTINLLYNVFCFF